MLLLFIILPCVAVAVAVVALLDRRGWLSSFEPGPAPRPVAPEISDVLRRVLALSAMAIMSAWILAWVVGLVVGLRIILGSG